MTLYDNPWLTSGKLEWELAPGEVMRCIDTTANGPDGSGPWTGVVIKNLDGLELACGYIRESFKWKEVMPK